MGRAPSMLCNNAALAGLVPQLAAYGKRYTPGRLVSTRIIATARSWADYAEELSQCTGMSGA